MRETERAGIRERESERREREREKRDSDESALKWRLLSQRQSQSKVQQVLDARTSMLHVYACIEWGARKREAETERGESAAALCAL